MIKDLGELSFPNACGLPAIVMYVCFLYVRVHAYRYFVDWGDGNHDTAYREDLGPFQVAHQYPKHIATYGVTVIYCYVGTDMDNPHPCCDNLFRPIDVSYDPSNPHPAEMFSSN